MTDERAILAAILEHPDDDGCKLAYADWLEERGDPRGEYLRLMMQVRQERLITPEQRQRHKEFSEELARLQNAVREEFAAAMNDGSYPPENRQRRGRIRRLEAHLADLSKQIRPSISVRLQELAATLDPKWLTAVSDPMIEGCGRSGSVLRFDFVCDKTWVDMMPTKDEAVRQCESCKKNVYFCDNLADAREHSHDNHCIAVDLGVVRRDDDLRPPMMFLGRPSRAAVRQSYEEALDAVSRARLDARKQAKKKQKQKR